MIKLHRVDILHIFNRKLKSNQVTAIFERTKERVFERIGLNVHIKEVFTCHSAVKRMSSPQRKSFYTEANSTNKKSSFSIYSNSNFSNFNYKF